MSALGVAVCLVRRIVLTDCLGGKKLANPRVNRVVSF